MSLSSSFNISFLAEAGGVSPALFTFLAYTSAVFLLAVIANYLRKDGNFLREYFLGNRGLGVWAFALTFAATSASGGSFTGFPSKIYSHGWIMGLWIGSYIIFPICTMGFIGKRLNQVARRSGAITVPDVIRDRFRSASFGLLAVALIVFFMSFNLIAQFKAGSMMLKTLLTGVGVFESGVTFLRDSPAAHPDPAYLLCLFGFGLAVIAYTTYGGFQAVVWTDVMQGIVMVVGVIIMLPLALYLVGKEAPEGVGSLEYATSRMVDMSPPRRGVAVFRSSDPKGNSTPLGEGSWIQIPGSDEGAEPRLFKVIPKRALEERLRERGEPWIAVLEIISPGDRRQVVENQGDRVRSDFILEGLELQGYAYGAEDGRKGVYVTGPGPSPSSDAGFLPLSLVISFFFMWAISGSGQPASMVRLMAFNNTVTLRRSIFTVAVYYSLIYFPLVIIFCCARVLMPGMDAESDRIMPAMAVFLTENVGAGWLAGLLIAAPFAAVMSTVDSFLLMISSGLVRDIYQRNMNPEASERRLKRLSYLFTLLVGGAALLGAVHPPQFLQDIIVYTGSGLAACFLAPVVYAIYWPRSNVEGCMAGMLGGFAAHLSMYVGGHFANGSFFRPYRLMDFDPIIVGLLVSFLAGYLVTLRTPPPPEDLVRKYFYKPEASTGA
tara:strand:+ start:127 stop:2112 length:1986 start_codon:yes stop_codon:yes gene_type:complete